MVSVSRSDPKGGTYWVLRRHEDVGREERNKVSTRQVQRDRDKTKASGEKAREGLSPTSSVDAAAALSAHRL